MLIRQTSLIKQSIKVFVCFEGTVLEDVTESPECGIAVEKGSERALGKALLELCENTELREQRSMKCRRLVEQNLEVEFGI